jgi:hypothetical protein
MAGAQTIKVRNAKGEWPVQNITPEKARELALFNAKTDALKKAGIGEVVTGIDLSSDDEFVRISNIEIGGDVTDFEIVSDDLKTMQFESFKIIVAEVVINAEVRKYNTAPDPEFQFKVEGINRNYKEHENLFFSITPYQNGYLRIFLFEDDGRGELIYPDNLELDLLHTKDKAVDFPMNREYQYRLVGTDQTKSRENNRLLFVFLKNKIRFTEQDVNLHSVLHWLAKIEPDKRMTSFVQFSISK